jgi:hypothetical protein
MPATCRRLDLAGPSECCHITAAAPSMAPARAGTRIRSIAGSGRRGAVLRDRWSPPNLGDLGHDGAQDADATPRSGNCNCNRFRNPFLRAGGNVATYAQVRGVGRLGIEPRTRGLKVRCSAS